MSITIRTNISQDLYPTLLNIIHESFKEHEDKGLHFSCSSFNLEDFINRCVGDCLMVAFFDETPIGLTSASIRVDKSGNKYAYGNITAISSKAKGLGVGTMLYTKRKTFLLDNGCKYMLSDTAIDATSSVNWHRKKCQCAIIGLNSFVSTNYYSYIFREDFYPVNWFSSHIIYPMQFIVSCILCYTCKRKDGSYTIIGKYLSSVKNLIIRK